MVVLIFTPLNCGQARALGGQDLPNHDCKMPAQRHPYQPDDGIITDVGSDCRLKNVLQMKDHPVISAFLCMQSS